MKAFAVLFILFSFNISSPAQAGDSRVCPLTWRSASPEKDDCVRALETLTTWGVWSGQTREVSAQIRSGYLAENPKVPFRGNIIYYEGLADSMINHMPLFTKLTKIGYRVIAFDYMGQGGSSGDMNDTRIFQITELGNRVWKRHARDLNQFPQKTIIGWSTGGLAAYVQAATAITTDITKLVLIAPGIIPRTLVGQQMPFELRFNQITMQSLTSQVYSIGVFNPHLDPIKPTSPFQVFNFAIDLLQTASAHNWFPMPRHIKGLVLLAGRDLYVNSQQIFRRLDRIAPHFEFRKYTGARHEIHNEAEPVQSMAHDSIVNFLR